MTSLLGRVAPSNGNKESIPSTPRLPSMVRVRRPVLAVASVGLVVASIAGFVAVSNHGGHQQAVLTVVQTVPQGQTISATDLGEATVSTSGSVAMVSAAHAADVVGRVAAVALVPGTLLTMADVTAGSTIPIGDAVVGVALKDGQLPSAGLSAGEHVMVVQTAPPGAAVPPTASSTSGAGAAGAGASSALAATAPANGTSQVATTGVLVPSALVVAAAIPPPNSSSSSNELVSVEVSLAQAAPVSVAAAAGQVSLVLVPTSGAGS